MNPPGKKKSIALRPIVSDPAKYITKGGITRVRKPDMFKGVSGRQRKKIEKAQRRRVKEIQAKMSAASDFV